MVRSPISRRAVAPARSLDDVPKLCDPYTPLDPVADVGLRQDLAPIRGGDRLARIVRNIRRSGGIPTLHLLTGHSGSGKTTELLGMCRRLERRDEAGDPLHVVLVDAERMLDAQDVELEDILVAVWRAVAEQQPAAAAAALAPLWKARIHDSLSSVVTLGSGQKLPVKLDEALDFALNLLRQSPPEERRKLRGRLGSLAGAFIEGLNASFNVLRKKESDVADWMDVAVVIDNLEKLNPIDRRRVDDLYLQRMVLLKQLDAHLVITVPVYLCYSAAGPALKAMYGGEVVVLPMIKVRERQSSGGKENSNGVDALVHLLERRVDFAVLFGGRAAAATIARLSGGSIRHALRLTTSAANECDVGPVMPEALERAIAGEQADFERGMPERWAPWLRTVAETNEFPADIPEDEKREMLRFQYVLEYQNGEPGPWFAVHPLVERCRKFQGA